MIPVVSNRKKWVRLIQNSKTNTIYEFCIPILDILKQNLENNCLNIDTKQIGLPNFKIQEITIRGPHATMG